MSSQSSKLPTCLGEAISEMTDDAIQHIADLVDDNWRWWMIEIDPTVRAVLDHFWFRDEAQGAQALAVSDLARRRRYYIGYAALHKWLTGDPWNPSTRPLGAMPGPGPLDAATGDEQRDEIRGAIFNDPREDPGYRTRLEDMTPEDRERMLKGEFADSARVGEDAGGGSESAAKTHGVTIVVRDPLGTVAHARTIRPASGNPVPSDAIVAALRDLVNPGHCPLTVGWTIEIEPALPAKRE